jgi:hypothetical protein
LNKVFYYSIQGNVEQISFLFFSYDGSLVETVIGTFNINIWEAIVPNTLTQGFYTVVAVSASKTLGSEIIYWDGSEIVNNNEVIAKDVRTELTSEIAHLVSLENGLTLEQAEMLLELYRLMGLDPTRPLYVDKQSRTILPEITQIIDDNLTRTIVTRIP